MRSAVAVLLLMAAWLIIPSIAGYRDRKRSNPDPMLGDLDDVARPGRGS